MVRSPLRTRTYPTQPSATGMLEDCAAARPEGLNLMGHDTGFVEGRLAVHEHPVPVGDVTHNNLGVLAVSRGCQQLVCNLQSLFQVVAELVGVPVLVLVWL
jgi:hypothetical protein